jgi:DNA-binding NtrC family response regulator
MAETIKALLVYSEKGPLAELIRLLERQGVRTTRARSCAEAAAVLGRHRTADLIFTDTTLPDGTWDEVEVLAERMSPRVPVIVVSRSVDITLYFDAMERGASDYIVPPFQAIDLDYLVRGALLHGTVAPSAPLRAAAGVMPEVAQNVENHTRSRVRTFHPQSGRKASRPLGG